MTRRTRANLEACGRRESYAREVHVTSMWGSNDEAPASVPPRAERVRAHPRAKIDASRRAVGACWREAERRVPGREEERLESHRLHVRQSGPHTACM